MGLFDFLKNSTTQNKEISEDNKLNNLRKNKRYKEISLERKVELENYVKEIGKKTEITAYVPTKSDQETTIFSTKDGGTP